MKVEDIFYHPTVKAIETEILDVMMDMEQPSKGESGRPAIQHLLKVRKSVLDDMFEMTDEYKQLLSEFNNSLKSALCEMRQQLIEMHDATSKSALPGLEYDARVFMMEKYPETHPIQSMRAKKIWGVLNNSHDNYNPMYEDGVNGAMCDDIDKLQSEKEILYLSDEMDNWNGGLDIEKTSDMNLCYGFHNLFNNCEFSIFDLLWVRDFRIEVTCTSVHDTGSTGVDDIDWRKCDYYD